MRIPHETLTTSALTGVIEEFVTRDGTDPGDAEGKIRTVRRGLESGELVLVYDDGTESCNIIPADQVPE